MVLSLCVQASAFMDFDLYSHSHTPGSDSHCFCLPGLGRKLGLNKIDQHLVQEVWAKKRYMAYLSNYSLYGAQAVLFNLNSNIRKAAPADVLSHHGQTAG